MAGQWVSSTRRERLPADWPARVAAVMERDGHRCTHVRVDTGARCTERATDVDHVVRGDDHRLENLAAKCWWHHAKKTAAEGNAARALSQQQRMALEKRAARRHPGLLDPPGAGDPLPHPSP